MLFVCHPVPKWLLNKEAWNYNYIRFRGTGMPVMQNKFSPRLDVSVYLLFGAS